MARLTRREYLQLCAALGVPVSAQILAACGDDEPTSDPVADSGGDVGAGVDAGDASDVGADVAEEIVIPDLPEYEYDGEPGPEESFQHGVASGDPLTDAVILWTRVTDPEADEIPLWWEISLDAEFTQRLAVGEVTLSEETDFCARVDAAGLYPGRTYYYRFFSRGRQSPVGRTRTAPSGPVERLRVAFTSCSSISAGYFHVYQSIAAADVDVVLHLGDYFYEYGGSDRSGNPLEPNKETWTLSDYRMRYAQYRRDADLQEVHRQHPMVVVWDDHESANNSWSDGAENHDEGEGEWAARKAASARAFFEWIPIRDQAQEDRIYRRLTYGDLLDVFMLDTRIWGRDEQAPNAQADEALAEDRQILGEDQEAWLFDGLRESESRWKLLGQQVMFGQLILGAAPLNADQWDGYPAARTRVLDTIENNGISDVVVLTGDIHSSWVMDVARTPQDADTYDPETGAGALAVEFVTPAVTSGALSGLDPDNPIVYPAIEGSNPHMRFVDLAKRGYVLLDMTHDRLEATYHHFEDIALPETEEFVAGVFRVDSGSAHVYPTDSEPSTSREDRPDPAP